MRSGSLQNDLLDNARCDAPEVGTGATLLRWTDRQAATVIAVSRSGHEVMVQHDKATRTDSNGMSDAQSYEFERDLNGRTEKYTRRKDGTYREAGGNGRALFGHRAHYHDYSF